MTDQMFIKSRYKQEI